MALQLDTTAPGPQPNSLPSQTSSHWPPPALRRWLWTGAVLYVLAWSLLPPLLSHSFALDVVESLSWGREWQWGFYKHPPLAPLVLHGFYRLFGASGPYLLSQLSIAVTVWLVWCTGRRLLAPDRATLGALLTLGVAYYSWPALEFNHNIAQMPLWAALGWAMLAALQEGRRRHWLLLGLLAGLGMLTKYTVAFVLLPLGLYLLLTPARQQLRRSGPWLALATMLLVLAPHLLWLWQVDWLPLTYASSRTTAAPGNPRLKALGFVATQLANHLPLLLLTALAALGVRRQVVQAGPKPPAPPVWRPPTGAATPGYLLVLALAPGLLMAALGVLAGWRLRDMWGSPMWAFSGLLLAACLPARWWLAMRLPLLRGLAIWLLLASLTTAAYLSWGAQWRQRPARMDWPAQAYANQAYATWQSLSQCPLDTVAGDYWLAGLLVAAQPLRPSVLVARDARYSPWITPERLRQHGALWVWSAADLSEHTRPGAPPPASPPIPAPLDAVVRAATTTTTAAPNLVPHSGQWTFPWPYNPDAAPLVVHWQAWVPVRCVPGTSAATSAVTFPPAAPAASAKGQSQP